MRAIIRSDHHQLMTVKASNLTALSSVDLTHTIYSLNTQYGIPVYKLDYSELSSIHSLDQVYLEYSIDEFYHQNHTSIS